MSLTSGPVALTPTTAAKLEYPSDATFTRIVIDNISPYLLRVATDAGTHWLPPYTSNVWGLSGNHSPVQLLALQVPGETDAGLIVAVPAVASATWYGPDEAPPGGVYPASLTGPAIEAGLAGAGIIGASAALRSVEVAITSGTTTPNILPAVPGMAYRIWNWGAIGYGTTPAFPAGWAALVVSSDPTTPTATATVDSISPANPSSDRVAGLVVERAGIYQTLGATANFFILYSLVPA